MDYFHLSEDKQDILNMSSLGLAYLGDAVYEVMVRSWLCLRGKLTPGALHRSALDYVAAPRQAALLMRQHLTCRLQSGSGCGEKALSTTQRHAVPVMWVWNRL